MAKDTLTTVKTKPSAVLSDGFNKVLRWIDINILPIIAQFALAALAAVGIMSKLSSLSDMQQLGVGIALAAFLAVKAHR